MSTFKKLLALTLALAMVLSVSAFAGYKADTYKDAAGIDEDCEDAIELLYALDIMKGDANGNFNPTATITRAEVAKMIYVILNYGKDDQAVNYKGAKMFSDVPAGAWYEGYVNYAATIKLVQGRGNGTFGPNDPVTTAEAAKMLLTAIGYSAEVRGYTGANWDKNVLSDAAILGLLKGYEYPTTTYAPRQWVAVMFENALGCYTFNTMVPSFNGLLISGNDAEGYDTMGGKYYDLGDFTSVAYATDDAYIDQILTCDDDDHNHNSDCYTSTAGSGKVLFANGKQVKKTGLKAADLGQKYRVFYNTDDGTAYSVRSLSETAEARVLDMEVTVKHATSSNKAANKYMFTIGDMEAYFEAYEVKYLTTGVNENDNKNGEVSVDELRAEIEQPARNNDIVKAIDTDCDGKIDYFFVTEYAYAYVTDDATSNKYGTYIEAKDIATNEYLEFNDEDRLYVEDCIISEDEIEENNIVKYGWDLDEGMYTMEVLPLEEGVAFEERDTSDKIYILGGNEYQVADKGYAREAYSILNASDSMDEDMDFVADGDLIVWIALSDSNYTDMADINKQLVLVIDAEKDYSGNGIREQNAIEYMTIDGETHIAAYQDGKSDIDFADIEHLRAEANNEDGDNAVDYTVEGRLFILKQGTKGRVYLVALSEEYDDENDQPMVNTQLDASTSLLDGYEERQVADLDGTGSYVKLDNDKVEGENLFFFGYMKNNEAVYTVIKASDLEKGSDDHAYAQVLTLDNSKGTRTTVVGGYIFSAELESDTDTGYLYIEKIGRETSDGIKVDVVFSDGSKDTIVVENDRGELAYGWLYGYTYSVMDDTYNLNFVYDFEDETYEIIDLIDGNVIFGDPAQTEVELDDEVIAITTIVIDRDQNADWDEYERYDYDWDVESIEFVDVDDLTLDMIEDNVDDRTYTQFTDYVYRVDNVFYVVRWMIMDTYDGYEVYDDSPMSYYQQ